MSARIVQRLSVCFGAIALAACVTLPKPLYFSLDMTTSPGEGAGYTALDGRLLDVDVVYVSDKLVRRDVLVQISETEHEYYHDAKWVSRLSDLIMEKLEAEFAPPADGEREADVLLSGRMQSFEQVDTPEGPHVLIKFDAAIRWAGESRYDPALERTYTYYERTAEDGPMPKAAVEQLSVGMEVIAAEIAEDVNGLAPPE